MAARRRPSLFGVGGFSTTGITIVSVKAKTAMENFDAPPRRVGAHFGGPARAARRRDLKNELARFWAEIPSLDALQNWHLSAAGPRTMSDTIRQWGCYQQCMELLQHTGRVRLYWILRKWKVRVEILFLEIDWDAVDHFRGMRQVANRIMALEKMQLGEKIHDEWPYDDEYYVPPWEVTVTRWMLLYGYCVRILVHQLSLRVSARKCWSTVRRSLSMQRCKSTLLRWYDEVSHRPDHSGAKRAKRSYEECACTFA